MSRASLFVLFSAPAALLIACGGDATTGTTSTGSGGSSTTTSAAGTGGTASGTTSAAGTGGSATTTTTGTTTSAGTSGSTSSASGSTGSGMAMGACTNAPDLAITMSKNVAKITGDCATASFGAEPATKKCIKMGTGLSDPCVTCFDDTVACVVAHCLNECAVDSGSQACKDCRATNCDPAFKLCSGLPSN